MSDATVTARGDGRKPWPTAGLVGFRVVCAVLRAGRSAVPIGYLPGTFALGGQYLRAVVALSQWTETHVFGLAAPLPFGFTGSSDTMERYAREFNILVLTAVVGLIWTLVDRRRTEYSRVHEWLRFYVRIHLATIILGYGFAKLLVTQFPAPSLERYLEPLGEFSPMGLLWTFMGSSTPYGIFTGIAELLGGFLLVSRRTATLGGLVLIGVMSNVVMLNFAYDVPVKIFSLNLLLMAVFIVSPDAKRLADVLVLNRPTTPRLMRPLFEVPRWDRIASAIGAIFIAYIVWFNVGDVVSSALRGTDASERTRLYGIYRVAEFSRDGVALPPLLSDSQRWRWVVFGSNRNVTIRDMSDAVDRYSSKLDESQHAMTLTDRAAPVRKMTLNFEQVDPDHVVLRGSVNGASIVARLERVDEHNYLLLNRGFHWIQEKPFNR